jgi:hypothetical protein
MPMDQLVSSMDARSLNRQEFYRQVYQRPITWMEG